MAVDSTDIGTKYITQIPTLSSDADIQTALKLYHYGQSSEPTSLVADSIAGHLSTLESNKLAKAATVLPTVNTNNDLNNITTTGFYSQQTALGAAAGANYPSFNASKYPGMLIVTTDSGVIYQDYQMSGGVNEKFWRAKYSGTWTSWTSASQVGHKHNDLYYLRADATGETGLIGQAQITGAATTIATNNLTLGRVAISGDTSGKIEASSITTTELGKLSGISDNIQSQINTTASTAATNLTNGLATKPTQSIGYKDTASTAIGGNAVKKIVIASPNSAGTGPNVAGYTASEGDIWFW